MTGAGDGASAGTALVGALGFALLCLSRVVRCSDGFFDALVRHVEAQRRLSRLPAAPVASYQRDRRTLAAGLLVLGWAFLGLSLESLLRLLLTP